jgi:beta-lactamase class A
MYSISWKRLLPVALIAALNVTAAAATIDQQVHAAIQNFPGVVSIYAKNLDTGLSYELRADTPVPTASNHQTPHHG